MGAPMEQKQKLSLNVAIVSTLAAIGLHGYLAAQHYGLKFGASTGESFCNVSDKFNCDAVAASIYSTLMGVPMAIWGAMANLILLFFLVITRLEWTEDPKASGRMSLWMAVIVAGASVVMGFISLALMTNLCLFCIICYVLSFISLGGTWIAAGGLKHIGEDLAALFSSRKWILAMFAAVPALAFLTNAIVVKNHNFGAMDRVSQEMLVGWQAAPAQTFDTSKGLIRGASAEQARMTIVEFADFRCPHCRFASPTLKAFTAARPDVRLVFKYFPLDGSCNPAMTGGGGDGLSCRLSLLVQCDEILRQEGWKGHDFVFDNQERINRMSRVEEIDQFYCSGRGGDCEALRSCADGPEARDIVRALANEGGTAQIRGTPSVFVNGKLLRMGHVLPVLETVYQQLPK